MCLGVPYLDDSLLIRILYRPDTTQLGLYRDLVDFYDRGLISFKYVKTFNTDEYIGKLAIDTQRLTRFAC